MPQQLILVDERNRAIGSAEKSAVHRDGLLHRAFSIFLVDAGGRLLLQRRSRAKYHSAGLWANSCCGHPRPGERTIAADIAKSHAVTYRAWRRRSPFERVHEWLGWILERQQ